MNATPLPTYAVERQFDDFDELADQAHQWNLDFRQIDRGLFSGEILQFGIADVHVSRARFRRALIQKGAPPEGLRTVAIPAGRDVRFQWRGQEVTGNDLAIFPAGGELSSISTPDFHVYTCSFSEQRLAAITEQLGVRELDPLCNGSSVVRCDDAAIRALRTCLDQLSVVLSSDPSRVQDDAIRVRATAELPERFLSAVATSVAASCSKTTQKRELALARAESFIHSRASDPITIRDICRASEVSQRTLEYAFVDRFGLTPKAFLRVHRLNGARRDLHYASSQEEKVVSIANRWGFWHMGQFAADYFEQFGELPSQTLSH